MPHIRTQHLSREKKSFPYPLSSGGGGGFCSFRLCFKTIPNVTPNTIDKRIDINAIAKKIHQSFIPHTRLFSLPFRFLIFSLRPPFINSLLLLVLKALLCALCMLTSESLCCITNGSARATSLPFGSCELELVTFPSGPTAICTVGNPLTAALTSIISNCGLRRSGSDFCDASAAYLL